MNRLWEFFEDSSGRRSMSRLLCFLSFFPATVVVLIDRTEATLSWYLGSFVLGYVGGKGADILAVRKAGSNVADAS